MFRVILILCNFVHGLSYIVLCIREARQAMDAAARQGELMKSLIDLEEEQRRQKQQADSAVRKDKVCYY